MNLRQQQISEPHAAVVLHQLQDPELDGKHLAVVDQRADLFRSYLNNMMFD